MSQEQKGYDLIQALLVAPESQMDESVRKMIQELPPEPTALDILRILDHCVNWGAASLIVIVVLEEILKLQIEAEDTTYQEVVAKAHWRI